MRDEIDRQAKRRMMLRPDASVCPACNGVGRRTYGNGSTWRGGMGTSSCEIDVCDKCWGSGDTDRPGVDLRAMFARLEEAESAPKRAASLEWFIARSGLSYESSRKHAGAVAKKLRSARLGFWEKRLADAVADAIEEVGNA